MFQISNPDAVALECRDLREVVVIAIDVGHRQVVADGACGDEAVGG